MLISATYDGDLRVAVLKFYEPKTGQMRLWRDNTGHKPYCYTKLERQELEVVGRRNDVLRIEETEKADLLSDSMIKVRKIVATDPLAIGGGQNSVRDQIRAWEADIKYFENYAYDNGLRMGTYYRISGGKVLPLKLDAPELVTKSLEEIFRRNPPEFGPYLREWAELLGQPLPDFKRITLDIEVANEQNRVPDSDTADLPVIAVSFFNEYEKVVYLLERENREKVDLSNAEYKTVLFNDEQTLLRAALSKMMEYPVVVTFNGDDFDLRYLKHRAERREISIREEENPITLERVAATLKHGIHIDLYQFFRNRSIQVYAFSNKYTEHTLNGIAEALLGKSKIEFEGNVGDLPLPELANYCLNDAQLAYELTSMSASVVMKLLVVLARIGKMPMNDVSRLGVSNWIRSMLFYEHRKINALIPRQDELSEKGGASSQAIIKGKKYKGGLVIEPKPGVYFDVSVLDFASLYPSLIKVQNLSYETVNCPHEECKTSVVPDTTHWVCTRRKGISSLVIGSLRDLRVNHYKPLARDPSLSRDDRELYNIVSQGLKVILNASYGVTGFETFAFYCLPVAEATAALGRYAITKTIEKCGELGISVIYGDTDSIFLQSPSKDQVIAVTLWAENELGIELDLDKNYRYIAFSSRKKNYFGVLPDGTPDIKGLTGKKSVHGDTPMVAKIDRRVSLTSVKEVGTAFAAGHEVEVVTVTEDLRSVWCHISGAMEHEVSEVFRVRTSKGRDLVLSGDHSVFLMDSFGHLHHRVTSELRPGDVVVGVQFVPPVGTETDVYFGHHLGDIAEARKGKLHPKKSHSTTGVSVPLKIPLNREVAFILGTYCAEGNASSPESRTSAITQNNKTNPEVCKRLETAWEATFGWKLAKHSEDRYYLPVMYAEAFKRLCGGDSAHKRVPSIIFDAPPDVIREFLRGVFSGDGYGDGKRVNVLSKSRSFMVGVGYLLSNLDIDYRIRPVDISEYGRYYRLSIIGASSREAFYRKVGFLQKRFNRGVSTEPRSKELIPPSTAGLIAVKRSILAREGKSRIKGVKLHDVRHYDLSMLSQYNETIGALLSHADDGERRVLRSIATMLNVRDVSFDEIVFVERLKGSCRMHDFSVPGTERFVAGNLPTLLHNSQTPEFLKKTFYDALEILGRVQTSTDFERARGSIRELLTTMILRLRNRSIPIEELAFNVMIGKPTRGYNENTPQHVKAAQLLERNGREIKAGDIISYVKTRTPPFVKPASLAKADEIDEEKYIDYAHSMFDQMLDALDFSFDEIMGATTLDLFWS